MINTETWGSLLIFLVCPILGALPLIGWITYAITGRQLAKLGTGNVSVSAAFYHGGKLVGILAVLSEALKGIVAVEIASYFFPETPVWDFIALIALVIGRYSIGKGAGTTNVVWGIIAHDPIAALFVFIIGGIGFAIFRDRGAAKIGVLILLVIIVGIRHSDRPETVIAAIALSSLLAWIYGQIPDDLNLPVKRGKKETSGMFNFLKGKQKIVSLESQLNSDRFGAKAANLSQLKRWGYSVPDGWVLLSRGKKSDNLIKFLHPSASNPLVVRSSVIGEDSESASAAGQYLSVLNVTTSEQLKKAIDECFASYQNAAAAQYRQDKQQKERSMAIIIQNQIRGVFSGVVFSRDPIDRLDDSVAIEALPGDATKVVSGQITPQEYRVSFPNSAAENEEIEIAGSGDIPREIIKEVARSAREIENLYYGIPQDIEWTYDGEQLWLLQTRPITNLQPIWTRKIAAEVIPGLIKPLTWSINRDLTCGVWGELFSLVLGKKRSRDLDFNETATLHYSRSYFNATLLGQIFRRMGLPSESLDFLTRGAKLDKPNWKITVKNLPGLLSLLGRELNLEKDFKADFKFHFNPIIDRLNRESPTNLSPEDLLIRIDLILATLKKATYYSILAPISLALRQAIFKVKDSELDNSNTPEVESLRSLASLADDARNLLPSELLSTDNCCASLFADLADLRDGESILEQFDRWMESYGYLSQAATDISVPRWKDDPSQIREIFTQFLLEKEERAPQKSETKPINWQTEKVQKRLDLKGRATQVYSQLLAHLRWSFLALENTWIERKILAEVDDIFFLKFSEIRQLVRENSDSKLAEKLPSLIRQRRIELETHQRLKIVPYLVYGNPQPTESIEFSTSLKPTQQLQGIPASPGLAKGTVKIIQDLQGIGKVDRNTILVVPYTDSGWSPVLSRAGGIIAEVGGRLSHGAIVAREYNIPAIMDVTNATQLLKDGQKVKINGQNGLVEILE